MEPSATAETAVEMWVLIDAKLTARQQTMLDPVIQAQIFSEAMKLYMTNIINAAKYPTERSDSTEAPRKPSEKQLAYIKDLGGDPSEIYTAKEASDEITRLRKK